MAKINLLPWRAERRAQRQKEFYGMLGLAAVAAVLLSLLAWFYYDRQISGQQERNQFLEGEITKVKAQNEEIKALDKQKDRLLARKKVIEELQANRSQMVHLFDSLVRTIPDGVMLTNIKQEGQILTLEGRSQSNARVSTYMRNLESSGWMSKPDLSIIEAKAAGGNSGGNAAATNAAARALPYAFSLTVTLSDPAATPAAGQPPAAEGAVPPPAAAPAAPAAASPAPANPSPTQGVPAS